MQMTEINLKLPFPPSANRYWRHARGKIYISKEALDYRDQVKMACMMYGKIITKTGPVSVAVDLYPPDRRRWDLDNRAKQLLDALQYAGVFADDSQIVFLTMRKNAPVPGGACNVTVSDVFSEKI